MLVFFIIQRNYLDISVHHCYSVESTVSFQSMELNTLAILPILCLSNSLMCAYIDPMIINRVIFLFREFPILVNRQKLRTGPRLIRAARHDHLSCTTSLYPHFTTIQHSCGLKCPKLRDNAIFPESHGFAHYRGKNSEILLPNCCSRWCSQHSRCTPNEVVMHRRLPPIKVREITLMPPHAAALPPFCAVPLDYWKRQSWF